MNADIHYSFEDISPLDHLRNVIFNAFLAETVQVAAELLVRR